MKVKEKNPSQYHANMEHVVKAILGIIYPLLPLRAASPFHNCIQMRAALVGNLCPYYNNCPLYFPEKHLPLSENIPITRHTFVGRTRFICCL